MPRIIIIVEDGRLGNQLFQYFAAQNLYKNYIVIFLGFSSLVNLFPKLDGNFFVCKKNKFNNILLKLILHLKNVFIKMNFFLIFEEIYSTKASSIKVTNGFFNNIIVFKNVYFQSIKFLDLIDTDKFIKLLGNSSPGPSKNIFIHIRRGDYIDWPSKEYSAICPIEWYIEAITKMNNFYPDSKYIIFTDDLDYAQSILPTFISNFSINFEITHGDECIDFFKMTECIAGILSPSSFSWWASYFSYIRHGNKESLFIAPNYWIGHSKKEWYPCEEIKAPWISYLDVKNNFLDREYS
jgi:hypothetical protein